MEPKRVELVNVGTINEEKKPKKRIPTLRFNLTLTDSTDKTCPEFSYSDLVKNALEAEGDADLDPLDPFASKDQAEEDKMMAIAKAFEAKYSGNYTNGIKPSAKKRKVKENLEDLVDHGEGYDLEDPFIDNTEAYDEIVPCNMTTKLGGFYINSGALDFKLCSDSEDDFQPSKVKRKKRQITSDSDSEDGEKKKKKKKFGNEEKKLKKKSLSTDSEGGERLVKKKKKLVNSEKLKMKNLKKKNPVLYWKLQVENMQKQKIGAAAAAGNSVTNGQKENTDKKGSSNVASDSDDVIIIEEDKSTERPSNTVSESSARVTVTVTPAADTETAAVSSKPATTNTSAASSPAVAATVSTTSTLSTSESVIETVSQESSNEGSSSMQQQPQQQSSQKPKLESIPSLPDTLSLKTLATVEKLKQAAKDCEPGRFQGKFFSPEVNEMLIQVEKDAKQLVMQERSVIYTHLGGHLPCSRETLMKKAKRLVQDQQDDQLKEPINKLKEAISAAMPALMEKYQAECAVNDQLKQERSLLEKPKDGTATPGANTESEDDNSKEGPDKEGTEKDGKDEAGSQKPKRIPAPRKKFEWTPTVRQLLCQVVVIKMDHYETSKVRSQSPEEFLKVFLDVEIRKIWPLGWIQTRMLFKESKAAHGRWTNQQLKPKKTVLPIKNSSSSPALSNVSKPSQPTPTNNVLTKQGVNTPLNSSTPINMSGAKTDEKSALLGISPSVFASPDLGSLSVSRVKEAGCISNNSMVMGSGSSKLTVRKPDGTTIGKVNTLVDYNAENRIYSNSKSVLNLTVNASSTAINTPPAVQTSKPKQFMQTVGSNKSTSSSQHNSITPSVKLLSTSKTSVKPVINASSSEKVKEILKRQLSNGGSASGNTSSSSIIQLPKVQSLPSTPAGTRPSTPGASVTGTITNSASKPGFGSGFSENDFLQKFKEFASGVNSDKSSAAFIQQSLQMQAVQAMEGATRKSKEFATSNAVLTKQGGPKSVVVSASLGHDLHGTTGNKESQKTTHIKQNAPGNVSAQTKQVPSKLVSGNSSNSGNPTKQYVINSNAATGQLKNINSALASAKQLNRTASPISMISGSTPITNSQSGILAKIAQEHVESQKKSQLQKPSSGDPHQPTSTKIKVLTTKADGTKQIKQYIAKTIVQSTNKTSHLLQSQSSLKSSSSSSPSMAGTDKSKIANRKTPQQSQQQAVNSSNKQFDGMLLQQLHMQMVQNSALPTSAPSLVSKQSGSSLVASVRPSGNTSPGWNTASQSFNSSASAGNVFTSPADKSTQGNRSPVSASPDRFSQVPRYGQSPSGQRSPHGSPIQNRSPQGIYPGLAGSPSPTHHPNLPEQYRRFRYPNSDQAKQQQYRY